MLTQLNNDDSSLTPQSKLNPDIEKRLQEFDAFCDKLGLVINFLMDKLLVNFGYMGSLFLTVDILLILLLLIISILLYFLLWTPFVKNLKEKIWRARSMMNLIPFEIIIEDKKLIKLMNEAHFN